MKVREIYCKHWWLSKKFVAITLYPFIFYKGQPSDRIRKHEWVHVEQVKTYGWFTFYILYLYYSVRFGYRNNPFELQAHNHTDAG